MDILTSGQDKNEWSDILSTNPMELLGYTFVNNNDNTHMSDEVKELLEKERKIMVEYVMGVSNWQTTLN